VSGPSLQLLRRPVPAEALLARWQAAGDESLTARLYAARGTGPEEMDHALRGLLPPGGMKGIDAATVLLAAAIEGQQRILLVGDFDADGATSCALGVLALGAMGAEQVSYLVPNRFDHGYGLSPEIVAVAAERSPDLLITVDNGISSIDGVVEAQRRGMRVIITDHHLPGPELPAADAIVNPNQPGCEFGSKQLAGVGVLYYLLMGLRAKLRQRGWFDAARAEPNLADYLDLVALGTVADVAKLDQNNRILVAQGLARIRSRRCRPAILALLQLAKRQPERIQAADLGFAVGPRLNAAGRLDDISLGVECLLAAEGQVEPMAMELDQLNRARRVIGEEMESEALVDLEAQLVASELGEGAVCIYQPHWHQGVVGLLAARIKEQLHRPVIAFADAGDGVLKGSARSVSAIHIRDAIAAVTTRRPGLVEKFGGHAMAAGLTLTPGALAEFAELLDREVIERNGGEPFAPTLLSDGALDLDELSLAVAEQLAAAGPWGAGFPEPLFDGRFTVQRADVVGERHLKMRLGYPGSDGAWDAIAFGAAAEGVPAVGSELQLAYRLTLNEWRGVVTPQLNVVHLWR